ncbi:MAG: YrrS family protein [Bacillaceae bacterium]
MKKRVKQKKRRKWINRLLNILIVIVLAAIGIVCYYMFFKEPVKEKKKVSKPVVHSAIEKPEEPEKNKELEQELMWIREKMEDPNVVETYQQPDWTVIETKQKEPHKISYEIGSVDWLEMKNCIAYATNLTFKDFSTWYIGRGEKQNETIGIISTKDGAYHYRVYMEWMTNKGWKPKLVQQLKEPKW